MGSSGRLSTGEVALSLKGRGSGELFGFYGFGGISVRRIFLTVLGVCFYGAVGARRLGITLTVGSEDLRRRGGVNVCIGAVISEGGCCPRVSFVRCLDCVGGRGLVSLERSGFGCGGLRGRLIGGGVFGNGPCSLCLDCRGRVVGGNSTF